MLLAARRCDELEGEDLNVPLVAPDGVVLILEGDDPNVLLTAADCAVELKAMVYEVLLAATSGVLDELAGETEFEETAAEYELLEKAAREENVDDCAAR